MVLTEKNGVFPNTVNYQIHNGAKNAGNNLSGGHG